MYLVVSYRAAAWIGYYQLLSDIIGYFLYSFDFRVAKMYGNNGTFWLWRYKTVDTAVTKCSHN